MSAAVHNNDSRPLLFRGVFRSEAIKLMSLKSTWWCVALLVLLPLSVGMLIATTANTHDLALSLPAQKVLQARTLAAGATVAGAIAAVLAVMVISREFTSGLISTTFTVVPKRPYVVLGKTFALLGMHLAVGIIAVLVTATVVTPVLNSELIEVNWLDPSMQQALVAAVVYPAVVAAFALGVATVLRGTVASITAVLVVLLVLPGGLRLVGNLLGGAALGNIAAMMPSEAGARMFATAEAAHSGGGLIMLSPWEGLLVLLLWAAAAVGAGIFASRRDL